jgi:hypothetical protein
VVGYFALCPGISKKRQVGTEKLVTVRAIFEHQVQYLYLYSTSLVAKACSPFTACLSTSTQISSFPPCDGRSSTYYSLFCAPPSIRSRPEGAMSYPNPPFTPSLPWRTTSSIVMGLTGALSRAFYYGLNHIEVIGLDDFLQTLDKRKDIEGRERGLITGTGMPKNNFQEVAANDLAVQFLIMSACR